MTTIPEVQVRTLRDYPCPYAVEPITEPGHIAKWIRENLEYNPDKEHLFTIFLDTRNRVMGVSLVSVGTVDTCLCDPRQIFREAILIGAPALILAHNHPSGDPTPSRADIQVTRDLIRAAEVLKIRMLDHIIWTERAPYNSLNEMGYMSGN